MEAKKKKSRERTIESLGHRNYTNFITYLNNNLRITTSMWKSLRVIVTTKVQLLCTITHVKRVGTSITLHIKYTLINSVTGEELVYCNNMLAYSKNKVTIIRLRPYIPTIWCKIFCYFIYIFCTFDTRKTCASENGSFIVISDDPVVKNIEKYVFAMTRSRFNKKLLIPL